MSLLFFVFGSNTSEAQTQTTAYTYRVELSSHSLAPQFYRNKNNILIYHGNDSKMKDFFANYNILAFEQEFPKSRRNNLLNLFLVETTNGKLIDEMILKFPSLFLSYTDTSDFEIKLLATYPNDYGATSPVQNLGTTFARTELDYLNAPYAWDLGYGNSNIQIGISDARIDTSVPDLDNGKVTILPEHEPANPNVWSHGTTVAALAAAEGNNADGSLGICADCSIISESIGYSGLYDMAQAGARVINMSWCIPCYRNENYIPTAYDNQNQQVINEITEDYGVVLVAAAGNSTSFSSSTDFIDADNNGNPDTPFGKLHVYPANFDNVISVGTVHHYFPLGDGVWGNHLIRNEDSASIALFNPAGNPEEATAAIYVPYNTYITPTSPNGLVQQHTINESVDILAPGNFVYDYAKETDPNQTGLPQSIGTSFAAPLVSGTIGLMLNQNNCLNVNQIETILKLTTKDIEHTSMHLNTPFYGNIGAGKLEIGDAVHFANEMQKTNGIARITDHTFYRFNFNLQNIVNNLELSNIKFTHNEEFGTSSVVDFKAGNSIKLLPGSSLNPGTNAYCKLSIDAYTVACSPSTTIYNCFDPSSSDYNCPESNNRTTVKPERKENIALANGLFASPNPFTNIISFSLNDTEDLKNVKLELFDITGRKIKTSLKNYSIKENKIIYDGSNLNQGIYVYQINIENKIYKGKIIKN